jgi:hypothetical protein
MLFCAMSVQAQPKAKMSQCLLPAAQQFVNIAFKIENASDQRVYITLTTDVDVVRSNEIKFSSKGEHAIKVRLLHGDNQITIIGYVNDKPTALTVDWTVAACPGAAPVGIKVHCEGKWCHDSLSPATVAEELKDDTAIAPEPERSPTEASREEPGPKEPGPKKEPKAKTHIVISQPSDADGPVRYQDVGEVPMEIRVDPKPDKKDNIKSVALLVQNDEGVVEQQKDKFALTYAVAGEAAVVQPTVRIGKGRNNVTVFDPKDRDKETVSLKVVCEGEKCGQVNDDTPIDRFSSIFTRAIVGFEQSGGSSADGVQKPFVEFFWNPPLIKGTTQNDLLNYVYPKFSLWGNARFTSVPQQISSSLVTFAPGFLSPIANSNVNKLVQGFDFLLGGEKALLKVKEERFGRSLVPTATNDVKQRITAYAFFGFGASSPLSPNDSVAIFKVPQTQAELDRLAALYPSIKLPFPTGTEYIAFVAPDRDVFFRQYYVGLRLKTHYFQKTSGKLDVINKPGAMFDLAVGQNEAVTGGRLHGLVVRIDGVYPLPVSQRSILYLYGNASLTFRRHSTNQDPLILATAPSNITVPSPNVFQITANPSNRDLYRIGLGVNLIELFKGTFNKPKEDK